MIQKFDAKIVSWFQSIFDYFMAKGFRTHIFVQQICIITSVLLAAEWIIGVTLSYVFGQAKDHYISSIFWDAIYMFMNSFLIFYFLYKGKTLVDSVEKGLPINLDDGDQTYVMRTVLLLLVIYDMLIGWNIQSGDFNYMFFQRLQHIINHLDSVLIVLLWYVFSVTFRPPTKTLKKESFAFQS